MTQRLLLGTKKGLFVATEGEDGQWSLGASQCGAQPVQHAIYDPGRGRIFAASGDAWFGPAVWRSDDHGATWESAAEGISFAEGEPPVTAAWSLGLDAEGTVYAGTDPAGLFRSTDGGSTWEHLPALRKHEKEHNWMPGGGGLILHTILSDETGIYVAISAVGVYYSADGGQTWELRNKGLGENSDSEPVCPHHLEFAGKSGRIFQQNHFSVFRSDDHGKNWHNINAGLPSTFGFGLAVHPRDENTAYVATLNGDTLGRHMIDGAAAIWRTRDAGATWQAMRNGLPQTGAYFGVYRLAMASNPQRPDSVYFGTGSGQVFISDDCGETWREIVTYLPPVYSVYAYDDAPAG